MNILQFFMSLQNSLLLLILFNSNVFLIVSDVIVYSLSDFLLGVTHISSAHSGNILSLDEVCFVWWNGIKHFIVSIWSSLHDCSICDMSVLHLLKSFCGRNNLLRTCFSFIFSYSINKISWRRSVSFSTCFIVINNWLFVLHNSFIWWPVGRMLRRGFSILLSLILRHIYISVDWGSAKIIFSSIWDWRDHIDINSVMVSSGRCKLTKRGISIESGSISFISKWCSLLMLLCTKVSNEVCLSFFWRSC